MHTLKLTVSTDAFTEPYTTSLKFPKVNVHEYITCSLFSLLLPYFFFLPPLITAFLNATCKTFGKGLCLHVSIKQYYEGVIMLAL